MLPFSCQLGSEVNIFKKSNYLKEMAIGHYLKEMMLSLMVVVLRLKAIVLYLKNKEPNLTDGDPNMPMGLGQNLGILLTLMSTEFHLREQCSTPITMASTSRKLGLIL
jgi:hypothetical protein